MTPTNLELPTPIDLTSVCVLGEAIDLTSAVVGDFEKEQTVLLAARAHHGSIRAGCEKTVDTR